MPSRMLDSAGIPVRSLHSMSPETPSTVWSERSNWTDPHSSGEAGRAPRGGAANREAAASLFVNLKTIEFHLGNIYRKLGVRSRTELANALWRRES